MRAAAKDRQLERKGVPRPAPTLRVGKPAAPLTAVHPPDHVPAGPTDRITAQPPDRIIGRALNPAARTLGQATVQRLQSAAGNRAVTRLLARHRSPPATRSGPPATRSAASPSAGPMPVQRLEPTKTRSETTGLDTVTPKQKERVAQQAADDGFRAISAVPIGEMSGALDGVYRRWQPQGLKTLEVVPDGDHQFTVEASVNPVTRSMTRGVVDLDVDPEQLTIEQVTPTSFASSVTAASGVFSADSQPELSDVMLSGASKAKLELTDSQHKAHAEEQVANHFHQGWSARNDLIKRQVRPGTQAPAKPWSYVRMAFDISKSSCINCASYIVRFTREIGEKAATANVSVRVASLYQGPQMVPRSNMIEFATLIRLFVQKGKLKSTSKLGRSWGRLSLHGTRQEPVAEVRGGKHGGKAGLAILRDAGISVDVLGEENVSGEATPEQKALLEQRNQRLRDALLEVEQMLRMKKG